MFPTLPDNLGCSSGLLEALPHTSCVSDLVFLQKDEFRNTRRGSATEGKVLGSCSIPVFLHGKFAVSVRDTGWDITAMATVLSQNQVFLWDLVQVE